MGEEREGQCRKLNFNGSVSTEIFDINCLLPQINQELSYQFQRADNWGVKLDQCMLPQSLVAECYCIWSYLQCSIIDLSHVTMIRAPSSVWEHNYKLCVQTCLWCKNYTVLVVFNIQPTPELQVQNLPNFTKSWLIQRISILHIWYHFQTWLDLILESSHLVIIKASVS